MLINGILAHDDAPSHVQPPARRVMFIGVVPLPCCSVACVTHSIVDPYACSPSTQLVRRLLDIEYRAHFLAPYTVVFEHSEEWLDVRHALNSKATYRESMRASSPSTCNDALGVFASKTKWLSQCGQYSSLLLISQAPAQIYFYYSRVLEFARIFAEGFLALFADEDHVKCLHQRVVALLLVTFCAVEPFLA